MLVQTLGEASTMVEVRQDGNTVYEVMYMIDTKAQATALPFTALYFGCINLTSVRVRVDVESQE